MAKRQGRKLVAEALDLVCGHCGKVVLSKADYAAIQSLGGIPLNLNHPGLVRVLRRRAGDDFAECPH